MNKTVASIAVYILFPVLWLIVIGGFLYSPYLFDFFKHDQRSISVFMWSDMIDPEVVKNFENETGIRVFPNYYESNDELMAKLQFSGGVGYDLIIPSHYLVRSLIKHGFIKKFDRSQLAFMDDIEPHLLRHYQDDYDDFAIPYIWDIYGLGINTQFFCNKKIIKSWQMLFDPQYTYRVAMTSDIREILGVASLYLFGKMQKLNQVQMKRVKHLLLCQKSFVEAYTDSVFEFLLTSRTCPVVFISSTSLYRAQRYVDWAKFIFPQEGSIFNIDSFVISSKTNKDELIYKFLNYIFSKGAMKGLHTLYGYLPARADVLREINLDYLGGLSFIFNTCFKKLSLSRALVSRREMTRLWLTIKAY